MRTTRSQTRNLNTPQQNRQKENEVKKDKTNLKEKKNKTGGNREEDARFALEGAKHWPGVLGTQWHARTARASHDDEREEKGPKTVKKDD
jgi:hypothetical protein